MRKEENNLEIIKMVNLCNDTMAFIAYKIEEDIQENGSISKKNQRQGDLLMLRSYLQILYGMLKESDV